LPKIFCRHTGGGVIRYSLRGRMRTLSEGKVEEVPREVYEKNRDKLEIVQRAGKDSAEIIIVRYNQPELEERCIRSVQQHTDLKKHRLTVVDNYTRDKNLGALWNELIRETYYPYVCLLNSDTTVEEGWLDGLVGAALKTEAEAVGPMTNHCGSKKQVGPKGNGVFDTRMLSGFCLLLSVGAWHRVRGFREDFPFYGQESDLMDRIGRKIICRSVRIHHEGAASVKASGRRQEEIELGKEFRLRNKKFDWSKRLAIVGSGRGIRFPLWKGIDQAVSEFSREGMVARHFRIDRLMPGDLMSFSPDSLVVVNTNAVRIQRATPVLKEVSCPKGLWFNDARDAVTSGAELYKGVFDKIFICFQDDPDYPWGKWEELTGAKPHYMPQGSVINPELEPLGTGRIVFIGNARARDTNQYHAGRRELVSALDVKVLNSGARTRRLHIEEMSRKIYREHFFSLVTSPKISGYNSIRLYNVLAYGGLALVHRFPGLGKLFNEGHHLLGFDDVEEARKTIDSWMEKSREAEQIRKRGWRVQQARHTVAMRLMNIVSNLTTSDQSFWGWNEA